MSLETKRVVTREWRRVLTRAWYDSFNNEHLPAYVRRSFDLRKQAETEPKRHVPLRIHRPSEVDAWAE